MKKLIIVGALLLCGCCPNYSGGKRTGTITKLSYVGLVWKSWEGEILSGGTRQTTDDKGNVSSVANVLDFNVDPSAIEKVKAAFDAGRPVQVTYHTWFLQPPTIGHSGVVIDVKEAN